MSEKINAVNAVPLNVITGFLGAGKTTAIQYLLAHGRRGERWAVLVNEFGKVGIDQAVLGAGIDDGAQSHVQSRAENQLENKTENHTENQSKSSSKNREKTAEITIKEVPGGCLCCTNHLPLQVALSQLITRTKPDRILIEPTGLGHPARVLELLRGESWRMALEVRATIALVDARDLADARVLAHDTFNAQIEAADVLVFSKNDARTEQDRERAREFLSGVVPPKAHVQWMSHGEFAREWLDLPARNLPVRKSLLHGGVMQTTPNASAEMADIIPPYFYSESLREAAIAGWVLPRDWVFAHDELLNVLFSVRDFMRVKGVFNTDKGWIFFNATRHETAVNSEPSRADSRLEIIVACERDWPALERELLAARVLG